MQNMETLHFSGPRCSWPSQPQGRESGGSLEKTEEAKAGV
jgi:hypothetical protein